MRPRTGPAQHSRPCRVLPSNTTHQQRGSCGRSLRSVGRACRLCFPPTRADHHGTRLPPRLERRHAPDQLRAHRQRGHRCGLRVGHCRAQHRAHPHQGPRGPPVERTSRLARQVGRWHFERRVRPTSAAAPCIRARCDAARSCGYHSRAPVGGDPHDACPPPACCRTCLPGACFAIPPQPPHPFPSWLLPTSLTPLHPLHHPPPPPTRWPATSRSLPGTPCRCAPAIRIDPPLDLHPRCSCIPARPRCSHVSFATDRC